MAFYIFAMILMVTTIICIYFAYQEGYDHGYSNGTIDTTDAINEQLLAQAANMMSEDSNAENNQ